MSREPIKLIYILGTSFCGSTLLGSMLGASPEAWNIGEVKQLKRPETQLKRCTCGKSMQVCSFWSGIDLNDFDLATFPKWNFRLKVIQQCLFPTKSKQSKKEYAFFREISNKTGEPTFLIDVSKSLWRLNQILDEDQLDVYVLYLKRSAEGTLNSFKRHGYNFWTSLALWKYFHWISPIYLRKKMDPSKVMSLSYDKLTMQSEEELNEIGKFLGVDFNGFMENIRKRESHVSTGNIRRKEIGKEFTIQPDEAWKKGLTKWEKKWCKWLT